MPLPETVAAEQRLIHPHDFRAFLVDGHRVEVVDLDVAFRAHRMRHRTRVLGELHLAQHAHVLDALGGARGVAPRSAPPAMSAENSWSRNTVRPSFRLSWNQSRQVTRLPVQLWKYSWPTTASMLREVGVGGRFGVRQHVLRVEDVEALVLHRAHVEVAHRDDHEAVQIEFEPEALLRPSGSNGSANPSRDGSCRDRAARPTPAAAFPCPSRSSCALRARPACRRPARTDSSAFLNGSSQRAKWRPSGRSPSSTQVAVRQQHRIRRPCLARSVTV